MKGFGNRFHPRGKAAIFRWYVLFEKRSFAFPATERNGLSFVFFFFSLSLLSFSRSSLWLVFSFVSFFVSVCGTVDEREKTRFGVLRETGFFPTLNYKTSPQVFFHPGSLFLRLSKFIEGNVLFTL